MKHKRNVKFNALRHGRQFVNERLLLLHQLWAWLVQQDDIAAKQLTRAHAQTMSNIVGGSAMSIGDNTISASTRMATPPWLTERSSAVCCRARSTTLYKGLFTLCTLTDVDVPKGRTLMSVTARQLASTSVDMRERTSTSVDARHRTLTDTCNICKCYMLMLYVNDIHRHYLRHQNAN